MCTPNRSGVYVARVNPYRTAYGNRLRIRPFERIVEYDLRINGRGA